MIDTHNLTIEFGKHKGELWTRVPVGYLKFIINEFDPTRLEHQIATAELDRRGDTTSSEVDISNHAIDRASLRVRRQWHADRKPEEGLYSWLVRITEQAILTQGKLEKLRTKGVVLVLVYGNSHPTLKTVMAEKPLKNRRKYNNKAKQAYRED